MQNKANFPDGQNECIFNINKGLRKKRHFRSPKNKANSKPICRTTKMSVCSTLTRVYERNGIFAARKTKPICRGAQNEGKFCSNKVLWRYGHLDGPAEQTQTKPISASSLSFLPGPF